jgi:hypothetical protein
MSSATAIRGNSIYTVVDGTSWTQAEANSTKLGGHLATINNADERRWLSENVYGNKTHIDRLKSNAQIISELDGYFIGLNDKASNGIFQWAGGGVVEWADPSEYIHPAYYADQGYLIDGFDYGAVHSNSDGLTPDIGFSLGDTHSYYANDGIFYRGIAETLFIRWKDSAYVAVQGPTWEEAEANAAKLGGHLVTINDTGENNFLVERGFKGWIGLTDKQTEGTWEWSSGEPFSLEEWIQNIFNRDDAPPLGQDYVYLDDDQEGAIQWDSVHPSQVSIGGIAEIKLAPNNQPTGAPALSGIFKAGQVISIDRTLLQDADNFAGYNPGFRYFWEVSTDGNTWSRLISADAVDSDTTYTLTSTEVGKQIRGIVSYLDGHGTQESVASNSSIIVTQENRPPTDLSLSSGGIAENSYAGSLVGTLSAIDADADSSFTYDLVAGTVATMPITTW